MAVNPQFEIETLNDLATLSKAQPGKLNYAGNDTSGHLAMEMLKRAGGLDIQHIPYKGG